VQEKVNQDLLYYGVKSLRTNKRAGTVKVKTRGEVYRTGKKIYRQKGTGNARHGACTANIFVGGGKAHAPRPRSFFEKLNKKTRRRAYQEVFKYLLQNGKLKVLETVSFDKPSTKQAAKVMGALGLKKALVYLPVAEKNANLSFRNLSEVNVAMEENLNLYEILRFDNVVMTAKFFEGLKERYAL
jgi:large subunit ribosomal protein L4